MNCPHENCNRSFNNAKSLSNHIRWHNPEKWQELFKEKISKLQKGENNSTWKGDEVSYRSLHN